MHCLHSRELAVTQTTLRSHDFHPGWKWEKTQDVDWAKLPTDPKHVSGFSVPKDGGFPKQPRWFTDIDGDGLTDRLESSGERVADFETAYVEFTQRYAKNYLTANSTGPAQIPFVFDFNQNHLLIALLPA